MGVRLPYDLTPQDVAGAAKVALRVFRALSVHNADPPALHVYWIERMEERWLRGTLLGNHCRMVQMECTSDKNLALRTPFHSSWLLHVVASAIQYLKGSRKQNLKVYTCTLEWQSSRSAMMVGNTKTIETIKVDEFRPKNRQKKSAASSGKPTSDDEAEELLATQQTAWTPRQLTRMIGSKPLEQHLVLHLMMRTLRPPPRNRKEQRQLT